MVEPKESILKSLAGVLVPVFKPLGLGYWEICTSLISGIIAKESVVSTMEILFGAEVISVLSSASAASMLAFSLLYSPCIAAISAIKREMGLKWACILVLWQCSIAWGVAFAVYNICLKVM